MKDTLLLALLIAAIIIGFGLLFVLIYAIMEGITWIIQNFDNLHWALQTFITGCTIGFILVITVPIIAHLE